MKWIFFLIYFFKYFFRRQYSALLKIKIPRKEHFLHSCVTMRVFEMIFNIILKFMCIYVRKGIVIKHFKLKRMFLEQQADC